MGSRQAGFDGGVLGRVLFSPFRLALGVFLGLAGLLLLAWTVFWLSAAHLWPNGKAGMHDLLQAEWLAGAALVQRQGGSDSALAVPANGLYGLVFGVSGVHDMGRRFAEGTPLSIPDTVARDTYIARHNEIEVAMVGTQLLGVRSGILLRYLPLLGLLYLVGAVDGLALRAVRRIQGGRESAGVYHRAKFMQLGLVALGGGVLMVWPWPVAWGWMAGLAAGLLGLLTAVQWRYYKKHL